MYTYESLNAMTVNALRKLVVSLNIVGYTKKRKHEIIEAIMQRQSNDNRIDEIDFNISSEREDNNWKSLIRVSCGANSDEFPVCGKTVSEVANVLSEILNIDSVTSPLVNGESVEKDYVLKSGDNLEFVKPSGQKG